MIFSLSSEGISSVSQEASHLLVRKTHRLAHFSRPDRGEADQGFHLRVRSSSTTPCLNASSSALSKSLAGFAGEVSLQQLASDFPSLRMGNCLEDPRHPSANLLSCKGEVRGRVWSL